MSNGGRTFTVSLNPAYKWSDGKPLTANDVLFDVLQVSIKAAISISPSDYAAYVPDQFPANMTAKALNSTTVQMTFNKVVQPGLGHRRRDRPDHAAAVAGLGHRQGRRPAGELDQRRLGYAKSVYQFLAAESGQESTYASNPVWQVVDGYRSG